MWLQTVSGLLLVVVTPSLSLHTREPPTPERLSRNTPVEGWADIRLNHFMAYNNDTFKMRYYYNDAESYGRNIVIFVGGEWRITPGYAAGGFGYQLAERLRAGLFYTEHRFYGDTKPVADTCVSGLRFLTVDQALADLAQFIEYIKSDNFDYGLYRHAKVALVGCSYAGSMVTWMRLAYPHLVDAAFSDSGPLLAQEDFPEYLEVIDEAISSQGGGECISSIQQGMERVVELIATAEGRATVSQMFNTCTTLTANQMDRATFFLFGITETFAYLVQYARPGQIPDACAVLNNTSVSDPAQRLANWINTRTGQDCIETRYSEIVARHTNTSFDSPDAVMRLWTYQTCVEYGWYQTTSGTRHPFLSTVPLEYFHQMCKDFFSSYFNEDFLRSGIERTNLFFGGGHLPDRVVTVLGGHDPWTPMGPNPAHAHHLAPVHVVPGISHCRAIEAIGTTENEELEATKKLVMDQMYNFIYPPQPPIAAASGYYPSITVLAAAIAYLLM